MGMMCLRFSRSGWDETTYKDACLFSKYQSQLTHKFSV